MDELREQFNAAWDEHASEEEKSAEEPAAHIEAAAEKEPAVEPVAEVVQPVVEPDDSGAASEPTTEIEGEQAPAGEAEAAAAPQEAAPATWSPANREHWATLPADVQTQIAKREREVDEVLRNSAESRKHLAALEDVISPYRDHMSRQGIQDPLFAISNLLQVEHGLAMGTPAQKAQQVATIIQQYGIDIGTLADVIQGTPVNTEQDQLGQMIDQRLAPLNNMVQQYNQFNQYQNDQHGQIAVGEVAQFESTHEFINDVRIPMANLMEAAATSGYNMTLEQAYDQACNFHPEVAPILAQRAEQQQLMGTTAGIAQKKALAGTSLTGSQGGTGEGGGSLDIRQQLTDAWESQRG